MGGVFCRHAWPSVQETLGPILLRRGDVRALEVLGRSALLPWPGLVDFFKSVRKVRYDVIVTNPPYSTNQLIVATLVSVGKPFVLLMRTSVRFSLWFRRMVPTFKLVLPSRQVDFTGLNGQKLSFDAVFICVGCTAGRSLMVCPRE